EIAPKSYGGSLAGIKLAEIYIKQKNYDQAEVIFQDILRSREDELAARAQMMMGDLMLAKGDEEAAISEYLKVKYLYKGFAEWVAESLMKAAALYEKHQKPEQAKKLRDEVKENYPQYYREGI
ncbi:MAG: hypothetical protein D6732_23605, partial [Methanobacteriota archaeon]